VHTPVWLTTSNSEESALAVIELRLSEESVSQSVENSIKQFLKNSVVKVF